MSTQPDPGPGESPLSPEQRRELGAAEKRLRKRILGAAKVATFNGWTLGAFGVLSLLTAAFSVVGLVAGAVLLGFAWNELRGRRRLRALDPEGPRILAWNQVGLAAGVLAYCAWSAYRAMARPDPMLASLEETVGLSAGEIGRLSAIGYGAVFVLTALVLGLTARYYGVRAARLEDYLRETPAWLVDLQRSIHSQE